MSAPTCKVFEFGPFRFHEDDRLLFCGNTKVPLAPKNAEVLFLLLSRAGHVLDRDELTNTVWPKTFVEDGSLTRIISQLRKTFGEDEANPYIETIPKRGYRFVANVRVCDVAAGPAPIAPQPTPVLPPEDAPVAPVPPQPRRKLLILIPLAALALLLLSLGVPTILTRFEQGTRAREVPFTTLPGGEYEPVFSPDGTQVAFVWNGPDAKHFGLYVKPVSGGGQERITRVSEADEGSPAWSPDGKHLAFIRYNTGGSDGVYVVGLQDKSEHKLAAIFPVARIFARKLDWSPDGNTVAVVDQRSAEEPFQIDFLQGVTGIRRQGTKPPRDSFGDTCPVFSPSGRQLAFKRSTRSGSSEIHVLDLRSGVSRPITSESRSVAAIDWTPDGKQIVFASERNGGHHLWRVPVFGGVPKLILGIGQGATFFSVARKANRLVYSYWFADTNIWRFDAARARQHCLPRRVIASTRADTSAQYSPDGSKIAFRSDQSGATEIWVAESSGNNPRQLTSFGGPLTGSPRWSPDGRFLAFDSRPEGKSAIYVIPVAGGQPRRITLGPGEDAVPSWSHEGKWIYFASTRSGRWEVWKSAAEPSSNPIQLTHAGGFAAFESPDKQYLYYAKGSNSPGLWRIPTAGGREELVLPDLKAGYWGCWGVAENGVYFVDHDAAGKFEIRSFDPANLRTTSVTPLPKAPPFGDSGFSVSRDGQSFLVTQTDQSGSDLILVNNFR